MWATLLLSFFKKCFTSWTRIVYQNNELLVIQWFFSSRYLKKYHHAAPYVCIQNTHAPTYAPLQLYTNLYRLVGKCAQHSEEFRKIYLYILRAHPLSVWMRVKHNLLRDDSKASDIVKRAHEIGKKKKILREESTTRWLRIVWGRFSKRATTYIAVCGKS